MNSTVNTKPSKRKILITCLGTGSLADKENNNKTISSENIDSNFLYHKLLDGKYDYKLAKYIMTDAPEQITESCFVGEILEKNFLPDHIFIIGTAQSMWDGFYMNFAKERNFDTFEELFQLKDLKYNNKEYIHDEETYQSTLEGYQKTLNKLFCNQEQKNLYFEQRTPRITPILIEYGLNEKELSYNYDKVKNELQKILEKDQDNEIAFDITHAFRSIPIYILTVLNYLKSHGKYPINISHVYYGNLDISHEIEKALVVDLKTLINVMDITTGVEAFRNTGNVAVLINNFTKLELPDMDGSQDTVEKGFIALLKDYEWATQCNNYDKIVEALHNIHDYQELNAPLSNVKNDAIQLVKDMLEEHLPLSDNASDKSEEELQKEKWEMQYFLSKWYYKQHQYGLALATGLEALRTFFVRIYFEKHQGENPNEESTRRNAETVLINLGKKTEDPDVPEELVEMRGLLSATGKNISSAKEIRNIFAHCLSEDKDEEEEANNQPDDAGNEASAKIIDDFFASVSGIYVISRDNGKTDLLKKAYHFKPATAGTQAPGILTPKKVILITGSKKSAVLIPNNLKNLCNPKSKKSKWEIKTESTFIISEIEKAARTDLQKNGVLSPQPSQIQKELVARLQKGINELIKNDYEIICLYHDLSALLAARLYDLYAQPDWRHSVDFNRNVITLTKNTLDQEEAN